MGEPVVVARVILVTPVTPVTPEVGDAVGDAVGATK